MNTLKTNESGRSMIEMLGVLAIIGVLSVGGIAGYSKAMNKFKTNKVADNVSMMVANIKTMYAQQKTYSGLTTDTARKMGLIPDELVKVEKGDTDADTTYTYRNAYNGVVSIHTAGSTIATDKTANTTQDSKAFVIFFGGLSKEACITLATNDWGSGYSSGLIAIRAAGTSTVGTDDKALDGVLIGDAGTAAAAGTTAGAAGGSAIATPGGSTLPVPMSVTSAATACGCSYGNTCSLTWKYY